MSDQAKCQLCGEPMPPGEEMFKLHGYSGPCPKPPLPRPDAAMEEQELLFGTGNWKVRLRGDQVSIIDEQGRERHRSKGHVKTAAFLAMRLYELPFDSTPNLDEALRMMAENFVSGKE